MTADLKTQIHDFAQEFAGALPSVDAESITKGHETDQMTSAVLTPKRRWSSWIVPALAVVLVVVLIGGAALMFASPEDSEVADPLPPPSVVLPTVVEDVIPETAPPATPAPEAVEPGAPITGITWQQIAPTGLDVNNDYATLLSDGHRYVYIDGNAFAVSVDGINWTTQPIQGSLDRPNALAGWQNTILAYGCGGWVGSEGSPITARPGCVSVINAEGAVISQSFDAHINAAGIGPHGIVAIVTNRSDESGLEYFKYDHMWDLIGREPDDLTFDEISDGVLHIETTGGEVIDYVLSEYGYTDSEPQAASAWYSEDGKEWTPIPDFPGVTSHESFHWPNGLQWNLVATEDGFVATSNNQDGTDIVWHSPDGLDWRELGRLPGDIGFLGPWKEGAVLVKAEGVWYLSEAGIEETVLTPADGEAPLAISASGKIGIVVVDAWHATADLNQIVYSSDGRTWINTDLPPQMRDDLSNLGWPMFQKPIEAAATDSGVLLRLSASGDILDPASVWYLGTPTTD
jgi:hypothetical protein